MPRIVSSFAPAGPIPVITIGTDDMLTNEPKEFARHHRRKAAGQLAESVAGEIEEPIQHVGENARFLKDAFKNLWLVLGQHQELLTALKANSLTPEARARFEKILAEGDLEYISEHIPSALDETIAGVERISRLVRTMKELAPPENPGKTVMDVNHAIQTTVQFSQEEWSAVALVDLDLDPTLSLILGHPDAFHEAILNLLMHAAAAISDVVQQPPGAKGVITIQTRQRGDLAEIRVKDTGSGISQAVGKSPGQCLSIVYNSIVQEHGGTVTFEAEAGRGTTFILRLPVA
ncbi:MAG TPA: ATP-binding protein [Verrucomicrobiae bacterium]|nr:ATP-binding protein [Verrucomicrobiae bacterium]